MGCFGSPQDDEEARLRAIEKERAMMNMVFPDENNDLKNASVVGADKNFYKESPWEQKRREDAKKLREAAPKVPAESAKPAAKAVPPPDKPKLGVSTLFMSFRGMFEDKSKAKKEQKGEPAPVDEKAKQASEYQRPRTIKKEDSVAVWATKFESQNLSSAAENYQSDFAKEKEALGSVAGVSDRQKELEMSEARALMTDEFKVKVGLDKAKVNYQPRGGNVRRLQRDLAGSTFHFQGVPKDLDD